MKETTEEWIAKAETDYDLADLALTGREYPIVDGVCFHSLCLTADPEFETLRLNLERLDFYAVRIRYPGSPTVTEELAHQAYADATQVRAFIRSRLGLP